MYLQRLPVAIVAYFFVKVNNIFLSWFLSVCVLRNFQSLTFIVFLFLSGYHSVSFSTLSLFTPLLLSQSLSECLSISLSLFCFSLGITRSLSLLFLYLHLCCCLSLSLNACLFLSLSLTLSLSLSLSLSLCQSLFLWKAENSGRRILIITDE